MNASRHKPNPVSKADQDAEVKVLTAYSEDIPGPVTEAETCDEPIAARRRRQPNFSP
ncbi:MAG TPA: DUF1902 domain-containing protein [Rhizomicrobium sp.]|jgi:hypothetical protein|nr:DUF1902 domain-containing protein [Rhizomicrobium sp.]